MTTKVSNFDYNRAVFSSELSTNARITALAIAIHYNWKTNDMAYPSIKTLTKETGLSKASIYRAKVELISEGFLISERRFNNSNLYLPVIPAGLTMIDTQSHTEELKDNIKDNLKDNNNRDSDESLQLKDINSFDILFNKIEGEINGKERTEGRRPAGGGNSIATRVYPNPGRYYYGMPEKSGATSGADNTTNDWMD